MRRVLLACGFALFAMPLSAAERVLSVGGAVTEIIYALDAQEKLVARDTTSTYPAKAKELPDVGYMRALSPEGVLSVAPDLILAVEGAGPPETLAVLQEADIALISVPEGYDGAAIAKKITLIGAALGREAEAETLARQVQNDLDHAAEQAQTRAGAAPKKVMFVLSTQGGRIMAAGQNTGADAIISLAGGVNAITGVQGYRPLSDEAILAAAPDVILMMDRQGDHAQGDGDLLAMPAIAATPAGQSGAILRMGGLYLLGFGPRTAVAVADLSAALYGR
ncbi:MAG: ABC transporter substrate-binding protein [Mangrovicoccus sp.]|nr:ABC transporter substrate-binding protein [Mangrovicoccus sp.]